MNRLMTLSCFTTLMKTRGWEEASFNSNHTDSPNMVMYKNGTRTIIVNKDIVKEDISIEKFNALYKDLTKGFKW